MRTKGKIILGGMLLFLAASAASLLASTLSDFEKSFVLSKLRTWDFKEQRRTARDSLRTNRTWDGRIRTALESDLRERGLEQASNGQPDFIVAYEQQYNSRIIGYGFPLGYRGPRWTDYKVWIVPYSGSTPVVDTTEASTNQPAWRGCDNEATDLDKADKTIKESVDRSSRVSARTHVDRPEP